MRRALSALLLLIPLAALSLGWYRDVEATNTTATTPDGLTFTRLEAGAGYASTWERAIWGARMEVRFHNRTGKTLVWADTEWVVFAGERELKREALRYFKFQRANGPLKSRRKGEFQYFAEVGEESSKEVTRVGKGRLTVEVGFTTS